MSQAGPPLIATTGALSFCGTRAREFRDGAAAAFTRPRLIAATCLRFCRRAPIAWLLGVLSFAWFLLIGARLPVDVDEGFYALAIELVARGRVPYRDFFYPQGPLYPYLLAPIVFVVGARFLVLRIVSCFFAAIAAGLVAHLVHRETRSRLAATTGVILFATHELSWQWCTTIRPYGLGAVFLLASFAIATPRDREPRRLELVLAGVLGVAAPLMRIPFAPAFGIVPLALLFRGTNAGLSRGALVLAFVIVGANAGHHPAAYGALASLAALAIAVAGRGALVATRQVGWYALGGVLLGAPVVAVFAQHWDSFSYNLIGYHADSSSLVTFPQNRTYLAAAIGGGAMTELTSNGMQTALLLVANLVALTFRGRSMPMAFLVGSTALVCGAARHVPMMEHYLTPIVPYLAVGAGIALGHFDRRVPDASPDSARPALAVAIAASAVFILATSSSLEKKWVQGRHGGWDDRGFRPATLDDKTAAVARAVEAHPGPLLPTWPGSALRSAERVMPGYENHFTRLVASKKSPTEAAALHLTSTDDLRREIRRRTPRVVVLDRESGGGGERSALETLVVGSGYKQLEAVGDVAVYLRD
ncbi:MAG: hypothetical protein K0S65_4826 [Labilithrix sp.]|nr:hypothetical protein [Labilithrix sp.]